MDKLLVTRTEAARLLSISVDTLDTLRASGKIKDKQIGVRVYFSLDDLIAFAQRDGRLDA